MTNQQATAQVWIVNDAGHDFSKAEKFGGLQKLTIGRVNPFYPDRLAQELSIGIVRYASPEDFLLISGTPILNALALCLWVKAHGSCKVLQWDAKRQDYRISTVSDSNLARIVDEATFG